MSTNRERLKEAVHTFAHVKLEADSYKKVAERYNKEIKDLMAEENITEFRDRGITVKRIESVQETFNESALISILKSHGLGDHVIKTREYVDMDVLEDFIYNGTIPSSVVLELDKAKTTKTVTSLRIYNK